MRFFKSLLTSAVIALYIAPVHFSHSATVEDSITEKLDLVRSITASNDDEVLKQYNKTLDDVWTYFRDNKDKSIPILLEQLKLEQSKAKPNDFFLLDIGYFLLLNGGKERVYEKEAMEALFKLDPSNEVVQFNMGTLFNFTRQAALNKEPRVLSFIDKVFLRNSEASIFLPLHSLKLNSTLMCVFLYGAYGEGAEDYLATLLQDNEVRLRVMEILIWIGSSESIEEINKTMLQNRDYETFGRALAFMMQNGGLRGQEIMLSVNPTKFDDKTQEYYSKVKPSIESITFEMMKQRFSRFPGEKNLSAEELKNRLTKIYENYGKDIETNPMSLLNSELPTDFLIDELKRIRLRTVYRLSDEALSDVKLTNALINALQYRNN